MLTRIGGGLIVVVAGAGCFLVPHSSHPVGAGIFLGAFILGGLAMAILGGDGKPETGPEPIYRRYRDDTPY